jgi:hypothetical protein
MLSVCDDTFRARAHMGKVEYTLLSGGIFTSFQERNTLITPALKK